MKICVRKKDNLVVFYGNELELTDKMIKGNGLVCYDYNSENSEIIEVKSFPEVFLCDCYEYTNGCFNLTEYGKVEVNKLASKKIELEKEAKRQSLLNDIISLEADKTVRLLSDCVLTPSKTFIFNEDGSVKQTVIERLSELENQIEVKRNELKGL